MRKQHELSKPLYITRQAALAQIPGFWPLVFEQAPPEIDQYIQPEDSRIFGESLVSLEVTRPDAANPRSFTLKFEFSADEDGKNFEDTVLEKHFHYRRATDGWAGLVSEPVKVHWKKGKDLTNGLNDMALALWEARSKAGDMTKQDLPEFAALKKKVESWNGLNTSFFTLFGWVSGRRYVSAEESEKANKEIAEKKDRRKKGEKSSEGDEPTEEDEVEEKDDQDVEAHEAGEELAISIADDLWPGAIKYFTQAQEMEEMSDVDFEEDDMDEDEDDDDEDGEPLDIRALVESKGKKRESCGPPAKKQKR